MYLICWKAYLSEKRYVVLGQVLFYSSVYLENFRKILIFGKKVFLHSDENFKSISTEVPSPTPKYPWYLDHRCNWGVLGKKGPQTLGEPFWKSSKSSYKVFHEPPKMPQRFKILYFL